MQSFSRLSAAALAAAFFVSASLPQMLLAQAPTITATKTDSTAAATRKAPGSTVTYTNTISNSGSGAATGVSFTDPDVTGATVVANSLKVSPIAFNDNYTGTIASGVTVDTSTATNFSVTANDYVGINAGAAGVLAITSFDSTSVGGGSVSITTSGPNIGKFTYTSAAGFTGVDSFNYTVGNGSGLTAVGSVTVTVSGPGMWYVSTSGNDSTGNGTLARPYLTLTKVATVDANTAQRIFVFAGAYTAGMTMEANEQIIGQGIAGASFDTVVLGVVPGADSAARPSISGTRPTITASSGNVINLASNNTIRGVTINSTVTGYAVAGSSVDSVLLGSSGGSNAGDTTVNSTGSSSGCLSLTGAATGTVNVLAQLTATVGRSVTISNRTGGTTSIIGKVTDNGSGIDLSSNSGATFNMRCLVLSTGSNTAFSATGGGVLNITAGNSDGIDNDGDGTIDESDEANTITTTSGGGLVVQNTTIGSSGLTFRKIDSGAGPSNGITLDTTGVSAGLTVTGTGSAGTGGAISGKTGTDGSTTSGIGVYLNSTANVSLAYMDIQGCQNYGIRGNSVSGFTLSNSTVGSTTANGSSNIADVDATTYAGEGSIRFFNLTGTASITNSWLDQGFAKTMAVVNNTGTLTSLTINNCTVRNVLTAATASDALYLQATGSSTTANLVVSGASQFTSHRQNAIQTNAQNGARMDISISGGCVFKNTNSNSVSASNLLVFNGTGTNTFVTFDVNGNTLTQGDGVSAGPSNAGRCLTAGMINGRGTFYGKIRGNTFGVNGVARSAAGNAADAIGLFANGGNGSNGGSRYLVQNNTIQNYGQTGVQIGAIGVGANLNASIDATVLGNTIRQPGTAALGAFAAVWAYAGNAAGDTNVVNLVLGSAGTAGDKNTMTNTDPSNSTDVFLGNVGISTAPINLYRNGSGSGSVTNASEALVNTVIVADNNSGLDLSGNTISPINLVDGVPSVPPLMLAPGGVESASAPAPAAATVEQSGLVPAASTLPGQIQSDLSETAPAALAPQSAAIPGLTAAELDSLTDLAVEHWAASGLTAEQHAFLRSLSFEVASLPDMRIGEAAGRTIRVDADAGGNGWFVGGSDALFDTASSPTRFYTSPTAAPAGRVDLLTTLMHEMGHALGLPDTYSLRDRNSIMYGHLTKGERRYPAKGEASAALPFSDSASRFLTGAVSIGVIPPGRSVKIIYDVVINDPPAAGSISSQGTVSGSNFTSVLTDDVPEVGPPADPALPGAADPTVTLVDLPDVSVAITGATSRLEDSGLPITYTFTRAGGTTSALAVSFSVSGTATLSSNDFSVATPVGSAFDGPSATGTALIPIGQSAVSITLTPASDIVVEPDETAIVTVTAGTAYDVGTPASATGTITNDDMAIAVTVAPASVTENSASPLTYTFTRTGYTGTAVTANFTVGGTASLGGSAPANDYTATGATTFTSTTGTVNFAIGDNTKAVTVTPVGDTIDENDETVVLTMATGTGYNVGGSAATGTITDDDLPPTVSIATPSAVTEGNSGTTTLTFQVSLTAASAKTITVQYATSDGTASSSSDYVAASGTLTFAPGDTSKTVDVTVNGDTLVENDETFSVGLSGQTNATLGTATATGTITNDDVGVSLDALPDGTLFEDQTLNFSYTFRRVGPTTGTTVANFTVGGTATFNTDYTQSGATTFTASTGSVTFGPGEITKVVTLDPTADNSVESNETIILAVTTGSGYSVGTPTSQTATIVDDDVNVSIAAAPVPASTLEDSGTGMVYTLTRGGGSTSNALTVNVTISGTAGLTGDYTASGFASFNTGTGAATVTFAGGSATKAVTITPTTDTTSEPNETVILTVAANGAPAVTGGYTVGSPSVSTGTITDDDLPQVSVATLNAGDNDAAEGGVNNGLFTFTRSSTVGALTANFQLDASSTAVAGTDFTLTGATTFDNATGAGTITFADTVGTATVTLTALTETPNAAEAAETARLNIVASSGVHGVGASPNATVTINANSFLVTTTADSGAGSLRQAVLNANTITGTDTVTFSDGTGGSVNFTDVTADTIVLSTGGLTIDSDLTIAGAGADKVTVSGNNTSRVLTVNSGRTATVRGLKITGGRSVSGGGIQNLGSLVLLQCHVTGNAATNNSAGGVFNNGGTLAIYHCLISSNTGDSTSGGGATGGLRGDGGSVTIVNSTISGNQVTGTGSIPAGGIWTGFGATATIINSTITGNTTGGTGTGGYFCSSGSVTVASSIIAANTAAAATPDVSGAFTSSGGNLIGNSGTATGFTDGVSSDKVGSSASPLLPLLGALADNGGPTLTHALLSGSPALNAGVNIALTNLDSAGIANPAATTFGVADVSKIPDGDFVIRIDSELMIVSSRILGLNLLTVSTRGAYGTVATTHSGSAPIYAGTDQRGGGFPRSVGVVDIGAFELQKSVSILADAASKAEGNSGTTNFTFTVSRTGSTVGAVAMTYTVSGAAVNGTDFVGGTLPTGTATIANGSSSTTVTIPVSGDLLVEADEAFSVTLSSPDNGYVVTGSAATSTITNDDAATVSIAQLTNGTEGGANPTFRLTQTAVSSADTVVNIAGTGTATSGTDYTALGSTVTILAGQTTATLTVTLTDDKLVEAPETVIVTLSSLGAHNTGVTLGATLADTASIADNDTATLSFTSGTSAALESAVTQNVGLTLTINATGTGTPGLASNLTADLTATGGTAAGSGTDYGLPGTPAVTFLAGAYATGSASQNASVSVTDDRLLEGSETAVLGLSIATNIGTQASIGGTTAHTLTLADNDTATLGYTLATGTALEGAGTQNVGTTLTINAIGAGTIGLASSLTADLTASGGTATGSGTDYSLPASPAVTFAAGAYAGSTAAQNGVITLADDRLVEGSETAVLGLSIATNIGTQVSISGTTTHTLTVTDNDTATLGFTAGTSTGLEGQTPAVSTTLTITATGTGTTGLGANLTANFTPTGGTATGSGTDYSLPVSPAITFLAGTYPTGTSTQSGTITLTDDRLGEGTETADLGLGIVSNIGTQVTISGTTSNTLTITDNEILTIGFTDATSTALESAGTQNVSTTLTITATGTGTTGLAMNLTASLTSTGGTATGTGTDYTLPGTPAVTFVAGNYGSGTATQNATVTLIDDRLVEGGETATLGLNIPQPANTAVLTGTTSTHTLTVTDNDTATLGYTSGTGTALESIGTQSIGTTLTITSIGSGTPGLASDLTANLTSTGGTATDTGTDYTLPGTPAVTFLAGSYAASTATQSASVSVTDDRLVEGSETAVLGLSIATNIGTQVSLGGTTAHTLTLTDNDTATLGFTAGSSSVLENAGTQSVSTTLTITGTGSGNMGLASSLTANFTAANITASSSDYSLPGSPALTYASGTYASGTATQSASVTIVNDQIVEASETVDLGLSIATNIGTQVSLGGTTTHTLTITDNDTAVITLSPASLSLNEGTGGVSTSFTFTATSSNPVQGGFSLAYATNDGTAAAGSDYTDNDGTLFFSGNAGESQTITVAVTQDATNELDETFTVALGAFSGTTLGSSLSTAGSPATATILNDDQVTLSIAATDASADENTAGIGTWRITRNGIVGSTTAQLQIDAASTAVAADWSQTGATFGSLAPGSSGTAVIPDGASFVDITLTPLADIHAEADETAILKITTDAAYVLGTSQATVTIGANDFVVINSGNTGEGTLRQAVLNANAFASNDVITFDTPQNVVLTSGVIVVQNNGTLTILGGGTTSISGNLTSRIFNVSASAQLTLRDLWIKDGNPGSNGGAILNAGGLTIISSTLSGNAASAPLATGGAIFNNGGALAVVNSTLSNNTATASGGAIQNSGGIVSVVNSTISTNAAGTQGGGLYNDSGSMTVDSATVTANTAATGGGGLYRNGGNLSLYNSIIAANTATSGAPDLFAAAVFDDIHNLIGVNTGHPLVNGTNGDIVGTAGTPANALLGPLANNGGPTLTHALQDGSPAINAGDSASLPADFYDVDGDSDTAETLPSDQRGSSFARVIGSIVDIGSYEAFAFRPAITAATFDEDTQNTSGLVITPNAADGSLTTAFKITNIQNGTLYKNDGSTVITSGTFITLVEGAAGLKFTPALNLYSPATTFGFDAQATVDGADTGLRTGIASASITVNPVADTPSVTNTSTTMDIQSVSGLVVTRNAADSAEVAYFKVSNITHGTLYQNNGTTVINAGSYITAVQGGAGLKFTPATGFTGVANFDIQGSIDNAGTGLSGTATATIAVGTVNPTPAQQGPVDPVTGNPLPPGSPYPTVSQTGTLEMRVDVKNTTAFPINGFRLSVDYSAYLAAQPSLRLYNSTSGPSVSPAYIDYPYPVAQGATVTVKLEFYTSTRRLPNPFTPTLTVTNLAASQVSNNDGSGVQPRIVARADGSMLLEWDSIPGRWYRVKYSSDLVNWFDSTIPIQAVANRTQWIDSGAPLTNVPPSSVPSRFYRVNEIPAP